MTSPTPTRSSTVNLPVFGQTKKRHVIIGVGAVVVIAGVAWVGHLRRRDAGSSGTVFDPATGTIGDPNAPYVNPDPSGPPGPEGGENPAIIRTDAEWATAATERLAAIGWDPTAVSSALGKYITRTPVTTAEETIIRTAIGQMGYPPSGQIPIIKVQTPVKVPPPKDPIKPVPTPTKPPPAKTTPPPAAPKPQPKPAPPRRFVRVVKFTTRNPPWNSTLSGIAGRSRRSVSQLMSWNSKIKDPDVIYPGWELWIDPPGLYNGKIEFRG